MHWSENIQVIEKINISHEIDSIMNNSYGYIITKYISNASTLSFFIVSICSVKIETD